MLGTIPSRAMESGSNRVSLHRFSFGKQIKCFLMLDSGVKLPLVLDKLKGDLVFAGAPDLGSHIHLQKYDTCMTKLSLEISNMNIP